MRLHSLSTAVGASLIRTIIGGSVACNRVFESSTVTLANDSLSPPWDVDSMYTTWEPALYENSRIP